jgi:hypothetical protein
LAAGGGCSGGHRKGEDGHGRCSGCDVKDHILW